MYYFLKFSQLNLFIIFLTLTELNVCAGPAEGGLGHTPALGILSYVTTTTTGTATASGGLQHQSSVHFPSQSAGPAPPTGNFSATAKTTVEQHHKSRGGPRNVSFGATHDEPHTYSDESRARFALLSRRKMSLPNAVRMNTPDSADSSNRVSSRLKSLKI